MFFLYRGKQTRSTNKNFPACSKGNSELVKYFSVGEVVIRRHQDKTPRKLKAPIVSIGKILDLDIRSAD